MSLQTALTGLNGAQDGLNTVSNDLANASTTAFKSQTAEFSDIFPLGLNNVPGLGVTTSAIDTDFSQGAPVSTGNPLDALIQGNGFFVVSQNGTQDFTRDGQFQLSPSGQLISAANGASVMGIQANGALGPITVNTGAIPAQATTTSDVAFNLDSNAPTTAPTTDIPGFTPATVFTNTFPVTVTDSLGNSDTVNLYFVQSAAPATSYTVFAQPVTTTGAAATTPTTELGTLNFSTNGTLTSFAPAGALTASGTDGVTLPITWGNGAGPSNINFNFAGTTLGAQSFANASNNTNGFPPGSFSGTTISSTGQIVASYSNGQTIDAGTLAIANFINQEGLEPLSGNLFASTQTSGQPVISAPGTGQAGSISGGELEQSNASTSSLLVSLIEYQQAFQANASVIQTEQTDSTRLTQI
ncbi:MAG TPA: flagellar hook protein FlgE [Acidocella sp.]|jgi:flagellar hook protein FlgE|uniref:flagellar hook protein FlgE n=1 Tax=Acidocella sp. TaxID=50710 RepID=UPI002BF9630E|nr:flagellar hook protein FlgE [Acidocella sp.]HVE21986.1 flagellar hook protein FlgE [Acidocella sp.]